MQPFFKEFVVRLPRPVAEVNRHLRERYGIVGGYDLSLDYPRLQQCMLLAVTEVNPRTGIDRLVRALAEVTP
jgi:glycine dehydrogenase subunit 1